MIEYDFQYKGNFSRLFPTCGIDIREDEIYEIVVEKETIRVKGDLIAKTLSGMKLRDSFGVIRGPIKLDETGDLDIE